MFKLTILFYICIISINVLCQNILVKTRNKNYKIYIKNIDNISDLKQKIPDLYNKIYNNVKYLITDIDKTLLDVSTDKIFGSKTNSLELISYLSRTNNNIIFGVATGRNLNSALIPALEYKFNSQIIISSVGTEIYFYNSKNYTVYRYIPWFNYIKRNNNFNTDKIKRILNKEFKNVLIYQGDENTSQFKISFNKIGKVSLKNIENTLQKNNIKKYNIIYSHNLYIDILAKNTGKGSALKFLINEFNINPNNIIVGDDSDNGRDMLTLSVNNKKVNAVIPLKYYSTLNDLKQESNITFSKKETSEALIDKMVELNWIQKKYNNIDETYINLLLKSIIQSKCSKLSI